MKKLFTEKQLENYAEILFWGLETARKQAGKSYQPNDLIFINYELDAIPLLEKLYRSLIKKGFHVMTKMNSLPEIERDFFNYANEDQLKFLPPWSEKMYEHLHGTINLIAPASRDHLKDIDPERIVLSSRAIKPIHEIRDRREPLGEFAWTLCMMPTKALAKEANMPIEKYATEIAKACRLNEENPVATWENTYQQSIKIRNWLESLRVEYFHVKSEAGTNLKIYLGNDRKWIGTTGHNIPSAEIFTCPDCYRTEGVYVSNMPSFRDGQVVENIRLVFKDGKVIDSSASKGETFLRKQLLTDQGAGMLGEFSMTDKRNSTIDTFMANTLFDENVGGEHGNVHIAIGKSFPEAYSGNKQFSEIRKDLGFNDSTLHWDIIDTSPKTVTAKLKNGGDLVIYADGIFQQ